MKQITLSINETKFPFFMELISSLDFVKIEEEKGDSKQAIIKNLTKGIEELKNIQKGKIAKSNSLKDFLNEI